MDPKPKKTGTTILGILCDDGVIIASETRATIGAGYVITEEAEKIYEIDNHLAFTAAGLGADAYGLARTLKVETKLYKTRTGRPISVDAAVSLLSNIMYQYKMMPFMIGGIFGGVEFDGTPKLFTVDPYGEVSKVSDHTAYAGSGWFAAQAILDTEYEKGSVKDLIPLAVKALQAAIKRDTASGGRIDVVTITKDGFKRLKKEEIDKIIERQKEIKKKR